MVAHNATFDLNFVNAASERCKLKRVPFHPFATFGHRSLSGLAYGQTVLAKACRTAGMEFDNKEAHSAYMIRKTTELFCGIVNKWKALVVGRLLTKNKNRVGKRSFVLPS